MLLTVGRGPVPRHAAIAEETRSHARVACEGPRATGPETIAGDRPPRYDEKTARLTVGRGPVPRHAPIAGETRSHARMACEGPRATGPETLAGETRSHARSA